MQQSKLGELLNIVNEIDDESGESFETQTNRSKAEFNLNSKDYPLLLSEFLLRQEKYDRIKYNIHDWYTFLNDEKKSLNVRLITEIPNASTDDFVYLKVLSRGSYGCVLLATKENNFYALKFIKKKKRKCVDLKELTHARNVALLLSCLKSPFTVDLHYYFETSYSFVYGESVVYGKEFFRILNEVQSMNEDDARFYASQVLLALEYLHNCNILYRDLKPENIVADIKGYIKLIDFSKSKMVTGRTYTFCGTPEYMAPELIERKGYDISVDWWAFGVFTYELCSGFTPFFSRSLSKIFKNILHSEVRYPKTFSLELRDLLDSLLNKNLMERFVQNFGNIIHLKSHDWFKNVNWDDMINRAVRPPYLPKFEKLMNICVMDVDEIERS